MAVISETKEPSSDRKNDENIEKFSSTEKLLRFCIQIQMLYRHIHTPKFGYYQKSWKSVRYVIYLLLYNVSSLLRGSLYHPY